jgi:hypothetical protein
MGISIDWSRLEEADEFLELARKVEWKYGKYPEAWKLHIYATITRALLYKKYYEEKQKQSEAQHILKYLNKPLQTFSQPLRAGNSF